MSQRIMWNGKEVRDAKGRFTSFKKKTMWFCKKVLWGMSLGFVAMGLYVGGQMNSEANPLIKVVEAEEKFADYPLLVRICKAESSNRQFAKNGNVLRGSVVRSDLGYCQINETTWNDTARKLGYDIYTEQGNKDMAVYIYLNEGAAPWLSSKCSPTKTTNCWKIYE
jgi:hypothetical protein